MDNMFKDISSLITVEMTSDKKRKIISMKSAFENFTNLNILILMDLTLPN